MTHHFNKVSPKTISHKDTGGVLYSLEKNASAMHRLGTIAYVKYIETSDGRDNWSQCGARIEFADGTFKQINDTDSATYYLLRDLTPKPEEKPLPDIGVLRSVAIRAANKVVGAQLDYDLRPENPNGAAAIEIAEYEFDAAAKKLSEALNSTFD